MSRPGVAGRLRTALGEKAGRRLERLRGGTAADARAGRPYAEFAGVLDGRHLWLAVAHAGADDVLGLRLPDGTVTELDGEHHPAAPSGPPVLAVTVDLAELVASAHLADRVATPGGLVLVPVLVETSGRAAPVWTPRGSLASRERRPASLPSGLQPALRRAEDGTLELVLHVAAAVRAVGFAERPDGIVARVEAPDAVTSAHVLDGATPPGTLATLDVAPTDGGVEVHVPPDLPLPPDSACLVVVGTAGGTHPVARSEDDVRDAQPATRMPGVLSTGGAWQLRLGWSRDGHLVLLRDVLDDEADDEADDDTGGETGVGDTGATGAGNPPGADRGVAS